MKFQQHQVAAGVVLLSAGAASAQWTVTNLNVGGLSWAYGADGTRQVGYVTGPERAAIWNRTAASFVSVHPAGAGTSQSNQQWAAAVAAAAAWGDESHRARSGRYDTCHPAPALHLKKSSPIHVP
jgi:hypothetical protein